MYWAVILFYFYKDGHSYSLCSTERDQVWCLATTDCSSHDKLSNWGWQETTSRSLQARLIAIILFNCCFYFQGTISSSTLLGELGSEPPLPCQTVTNSFVWVAPHTSLHFSNLQYQRKLASCNIVSQGMEGRYSLFMSYVVITPTCESQYVHIICLR